ncbi:MAG TPA: EAL domain-containing protein [Burkholderiales bacterium]|nr:EAL domain-containing protein [Burkholderiales bacterium]
MAKKKRAGTRRKVTARKAKGASPANLQQCRDRFRSVVALSGDWYWEQDENFRFTLFQGEAFEKAGLDLTKMLGSTRWQDGRVPVGDSGSWEPHKAMLKAGQSFADFVFYSPIAGRGLRYVSVSGEPIRDGRGKLRGYRGIAKDITRQFQTQRRIAIEHDVAPLLAASNGVDGTIVELIPVICRNMGWACGVAWLHSDEDDTYRVGPVWGSTSAETERFLRIARQSAPLPDGSRLNINQPRWIGELDRERQFPLAVDALRTGLASAVAVAIDSGDERIGALVFFDKKIHEPDAESMQCMAYVGGALGRFCQRIYVERSRRESEARFRDLNELSSDWYWEMGADLRFTDVRGGSKRGTAQYTSNAHNGKYRWDLPYVDVPDGTWEAHKADLYARRPFRDLVLKRRLEDGSIGTISISGKPIFDDNGVFTGYRGIGKDITERTQAQERIQYLATHDNLTGLPNRSMFSEVLGLAVETGRRYERRFAVFFIDLDRFKNINDTFGHEAGDSLLKQMSARLKRTLRASDVVARLGGDEFVVLVQEVGDENLVKSVVRKVLSAIIKPMVLLGQECRVTASIGIAMYPKDATGEQALMKNADIAMYRAKEEGKNNFQFYSEQLNVHTLERMALETSLRRALERDELSLHYQAKQDLKSGQITGVEALLRWQHPDMGMISPAQFIPLAEETGLIIPIGKWVLRTACVQNMAWQEQGLPALCVAVNVSARQFNDDELAQDVADVLKQTNLKPELLELELTESVVMQNPERAIKVLGIIKDMGVRLAIDDFGTRYSSLAQIKRFPIDTLKVDRSFIREVPQVIEDNAITEAIINMGKTLSLTVIAEGVETAEQKKFLNDRDCDQMQGYYFSKPIAPDKFAELLHRHASDPEACKAQPDACL